MSDEVLKAIDALEGKLPPKADEDFLKAVQGLHPAGYSAPMNELIYKVWNPERERYEASPTPHPLVYYTQAANDMIKEILSARKAHGPMSSAHEGYAIMLEEMDEVKEHVWIKQKNRDQAKRRKELIQLGAMAIAMAVEIADADNRK